MERQINEGRLELVIRLDGIVQVLDKMDAAISEVKTNIDQFQNKCQRTKEAINELKDKLFTVWA